MPFDKPIFKDFLASIVVFLVAVPLCLGIAVACGLPPATGLISGIIGGIIVGAFSGCQLQVSGPAAGLVAIVWEVVQNHGIESLGPILFLAGIMQMGFGALRIGQWFRAVSPAVVQGMLAGIGVLILASQFHVMVDDLPKSHGLDNLMSIPDSIMKGIFPVDGSSHHIAAMLGVMTIVTIMIWNALPKKFHMLPAPLMGIIVAVLASRIVQAPVKYVAVPQNILAEIHWIDFSLFSGLFSEGMIVSAFTIALIASTESLLTAIAVDQMGKAPRTNYDKELYAQGTGNMVAGLLGALPITGVIVRSAANVQAGAVSRKAAILHGLWILLFLTCCPALLGKIPVASLAAILVYTGYKLINIKEVKNLYKFGRSEVAIYLATIVAIVMTNLLEGIIIGFTLAIIKLLIKQSKLAIAVETLENNTLRVNLDGSANFMSLPKLAAQLESIEPQQEVHIILSKLGYIDHACIELIMNWEKQYVENGGTVFIDEFFLVSRFPKLEQTMIDRNVEAFQNNTP